MQLRGVKSNLTVENLKPSTKHCFNVPESMEKIYPVAVKRSSPVFPGAVRKEWFDAVDDGEDSVSSVETTDMALNMLRHKAVIRSGWTEFNQTLSQNEQDVTTIGYLPILQAPAHEFDTLNTVAKRCMYI